MITHGLPRQLSAFRRRQPDLLTLPTLSVNDVANLIAMEVEKRGYEGVGATCGHIIKCIKCQA